MSYRRAYLSFALPVSLALACAACGNGNQGQAGTPPATNSTTAPVVVPPTNSTAATPMPMNTPVTTAGTSMNPMGRNGPASFDTLAQGKDFLKRSDAAPGSWLAGHFAQCDLDSNGKVSRDEFQACSRKFGTMRPQSSAPPVSSGM